MILPLIITSIISYHFIEKIDIKKVKTLTKE